MKRKKLYKKVRTKYESKGGILSILIAVLSMSTFLLSVLFSVSKDGAAGTMAGKITAISMICAFSGFVIGIASFKEKDKFERFSWIGSLFNGGILILYVCILLIFW